MNVQRVLSMHVTNGDAVVYLFRKAGVVGTHVPWRDALHEGPVPPLSSLEQLSALRGAYLARRGFGKPIKILHDFEERDAAIQRAPEFSEIVLWFEHDLYDQLQIAQILVTLDALALEPGRVHLIASDQYLGSMTADEIAELHPKRRVVTRSTFDAARAVWTAFTAGDPQALLEHTRRDVPGLAHMRAALVRLCQEFPWTRDNLSRSQRHALEAVAQGPGARDELFRRAQAREEAPFLGDAPFYAIISDLQSSAAPLVETFGETLVPTVLGRSILAGDGRWDAAPSRWIGGVDLELTPYLWDDDAQKFLAVDEAVRP
ncbi:MAG TPA: hypothetical protein VIK27_04400 [Candidatus Aquilonibacter sp.]